MVWPYELKDCRHFRNSENGEGKTTLLLWRHDPVTSSMIARWFKTCLQEAGIDTGVF